MKHLFVPAIASLLMFTTCLFGQDEIVPYVAPSGQQPAAQPAAQAQPVIGTQPVIGPQTQPMPGANPASWSPQFPGYNPQAVYPGYNPQAVYPGYPPYQPYPQTYPQPYPQPYPTYPYPSTLVTPDYLSVQYDQFGNPIVRTDQTTILPSAQMPLRNTYQPGTLRSVNRLEMDQFGRQVHVTGYQWMGLDGLPHGNLHRQANTYAGGVIRSDNDTIMYSQNPDATGNGG